MALSSNKKIAVAMSGGVDSSVAAALMLEKYGRENIVGLTMKLFCYGENIKERNCCSLEAIEDAQAVCQKLGIAHYVVDVEKEFEKEVIDNFISEYKKGLTPNPCIRCNKLIKFDYLLKKAREYGAETLVTGHYARIEKIDLGYKLLKATDRNKDQSYFLYNLNQDQLQHVLFPLGELKKPKVREIAKNIGLITAEKTESQDICFIPKTVGEFLSEKIKSKEGKIIDKTGKILGKHNGLAFYTIGQRKGLGGGFSKPMFVIGVNRRKNELIIGSENELYKKKLFLDEISWISNKKPKFPLTCKAKIRYQANEVKCLVDHSDKRIIVTFTKPQKAITPGQSIVFYLGEEIIGGGIISS